MEEHTTYHHTHYLTITHLLPENYGLLTWRKFVKGDEFKSAVSILLEFIRKYDITRLVMDTWQMGGILPADQHYLSHEAVPRLMQTPLTHIAVVSSESLFNQRAIRKVLSYCSDVKIAYFQTLHEARAWIAQQQSSETDE